MNKIFAFKKTFPLAFLLVLSVKFSIGQTKNRLPCIDKEFSVVVHIVTDSLGNPGIAAPAISAAFAALDDYFAPICLSFKVCEFRYVDNFRYNKHNQDLHWEEMQTLYHEKNRINVYYVNEIIIPSGVEGYAGLGQIVNLNSSGIVLKKNAGGYTGSKTLPHEMGHFFGLEHTFEGNGVELVDGSNCATHGDKVCDTPADPFVDGDNVGDYVNAGCEFISPKKDANGDFYNALVGNIMSYYPDFCDCGFTDGQYQKMANTYLSSPNMW